MSSASDRVRGFTMIEIIIVVAIMAILAGAAVPMVARQITRTRRTATKTEMLAISEALLGYLHDNESWPRNLKNLMRDGYLGGGFDKDDAITDSWGTQYRFSVKGDVATIESLGPDRVVGGEDPSLTVNGKPVLRQLTLDEMETIHQALRAYEIARAKGEVEDLPSVWVREKRKRGRGEGRGGGREGGEEGGSAKGALEMVVDEGFLPSEKPYEEDAWGKRYLYSGSPSDKVTSRSL